MSWTRCTCAGMKLITIVESCVESAQCAQPGDSAAVEPAGGNHEMRIASLKLLRGQKPQAGSRVNLQTSSSISKRERNLAVREWRRRLCVTCEQDAKLSHCHVRAERFPWCVRERGTSERFAGLLHEERRVSKERIERVARSIRRSRQSGRYCGRRRAIDSESL